ncbi:MAG: maltotransferase domain-containing protein, partial [Pseudomonas sp.]
MTRDEPFETDRTATANDHPDQSISLSQALLAPRIVIEDTQPLLDGGVFAVKAVVGETVQVSSKVYIDGHDTLAVMLNWRQAHSRRWHCEPMTFAGNDLWLGALPVTEMGHYLFSIEAWVDPFATYCHDLLKNVSAGLDVTLELQEGVLLLEQNLQRSQGLLREQLQALCQRLPTLPAAQQVAQLLHADTALLMREADHRPHLSRSP